MILKIIGTTDNKYLGWHFNSELPFVTPTGIFLKFDLVQDFGGGHFRYSNSNYVIDAIEVEN
mgnify:FL=1|tara:strand:- start:148 stop:333 length:186 start_codon:yes stop_codon:yes gene_type:complete